MLVDYEQRQKWKNKCYSFTVSYVLCWKKKQKHLASQKCQIFLLVDQTSEH